MMGWTPFEIVPSALEGLAALFRPFHEGTKIFEFIAKTIRKQR